MDDATRVALQRVFRVLTEIGNPAKNAVVFSIVRDAKMRFRNNEAKTLLAAMRADPGLSGVQISLTQGPPGVQAGPPSRTRTRSKELSKVAHNAKISIPLLPTVGEARTPWAKEVERRTLAIGRSQLRTTDHRQMHDIACLFVIRFMARKFTGDEKITRKAVGVAGQIRNVVTSKDHPAVHDLTVREFFQFGKEVFNAAGGYWDRPWDVVTWAEAPDKAS